MAFLETPRFPERIAMEARGGPTYSTDVIVVNSGWEQRNQVWSQARLMWDVGQVVKPEDEYAPLQAFFRNVKGRTHGFRFKDWTDYQVTAAEGFWNTIDSTHFQMVKRYTTGALTENRIITKPISGTVATSGTSVTGLSIDYATGIATVSTGTLTGWSGEFDVPVRFDTDQMSGRVVDRNRATGLLIQWDSIPLVEIRV